MVYSFSIYPLLLKWHSQLPWTAPVHNIQLLANLLKGLMPYIEKAFFKTAFSLFFITNQDIVLYSGSDDCFMTIPAQIGKMCNFIWYVCLISGMGRS